MHHISGRHTAYEMVSNLLNWSYSRYSTATTTGMIGNKQSYAKPQVSGLDKPTLHYLDTTTSGSGGAGRRSRQSASVHGDATVNEGTYSACNPKRQAFQAPPCWSGHARERYIGDPDLVRPLAPGTFRTLQVHISHINSYSYGYAQHSSEENYPDAAQITESME